MIHYRLKISFEMNKLSFIFKIGWIKTIYFNFHYLPFKQAIRLPIFLHKAKLLKCKGEVKIDCVSIKPGMIRLGFVAVSLYPNTGIVWENHGGLVTFRGRSDIGSDSAISIGKSGQIDFGENFRVTASFKITSYNSIVIDKNVLIAWDVIVMDTSFHKLKDKEGNTKGKTKGMIYIGRNNWIPTRCLVLKGTKTPDYCIFGAGSVLNKDYSNLPTHILLAGNPLQIKAENIWRDSDDDAME